MIREFRSHPIYYGLFVGTLALFLLLSWELWRSPTPGTFLFVVILFVATLWFVSALAIRVSLTATELLIARPQWPLISMLTQMASFADTNQPIKTIAYRQLIHVEESGRFLSSLTLLYYPMKPDGFLDLETIANLTLPVVTNQSDLRDQLEAAIPL